MQTFIISAKNLENGKNEAIKLAKTENVGEFDIDLQVFEKSLGIPDVRNIQKNIFLSPLGEKKALILVLQNSATIEAQNSILKLLEEPPPSALIFIVTANHLELLPTILSRAKLISINSEQKSNKLNLNEILNLQTPGDALFLAQNLSKDKVEAIIWLEETILSAREKMIKNPDTPDALRLRKLIHNLEVAHYDLKNTNTNPRLALENLFLSL